MIQSYHNNIPYYKNMLSKTQISKQDGGRKIMYNKILNG